MFFASDNAGPVHPRVMDALVQANTGYAPSYGADPITDSVCDTMRTLFETPEAAVFLVATGTAANALALATMSKPWDTIFCTKVAHINEDECNAPEFYTGGAKLTLVPSEDARMTPEGLRAAIEGEGSRGVHGPQRGPIAITQATEKGTVYSLDQLSALTGIAKEYGLRSHLDGARFANALVHLGCTPAQMTWQAGIDAVSFGGTKNGLMAVEAVVIFDPALAWEFELRRKRGAQLFSKHRYLAAQMQAYLEDDLWLDLARAANAATARLAKGLAAIADVSLLHAPEANMIFCSMPRALHEKAEASGAVYNTWGQTEDGQIIVRLVCDWSITDAHIDQFLAALAR